MQHKPLEAEEIPIQIVFQGGGAKLVALLAASKVLFDERDNLGLKITRVTGTSAGAIAGCILATGIDPEIFRKDILRLGTSYLQRIERTLNWWSFIQLYRGIPLFDAEQYRLFLRELFESSAKMSHLRELHTPVLFHATNVRNGVTKSFDGKRNEDTIEEALFCSSALPYIFETFKGSPYVDGGLISNFPSHSLKEPGFESDEIVGFSFPASTNYPF
jgi:NTE family protein